MTNATSSRADARFVHLEGIHQIFGSGASRYHALDDVSLQIARGEFVSLIGHSGCGKSTLLNIVAGLAKPTHGHVLVGRREVTGPGLDRAVVFQSRSLLPELALTDNLRITPDRPFP